MGRQRRHWVHDSFAWGNPDGKETGTGDGAWVVSDKRAVWAEGLNATDYMPDEGSPGHFGKVEDAIGIELAGLFQTRIVEELRVGPQQAGHGDGLDELGEGSDFESLDGGDRVYKGKAINAA